MKKFLLALTVLFSASLCFAGTTVIAGDDDDFSLFDSDRSGLYVDLGSPIYETGRLCASHGNIKSSQERFFTKGFNGEIGLIKSDEDGLFDWVEKAGIGFQIGSLANKKDFVWNKDNKVYCSTEDAKFTNVFIKDLGGIQINILWFSIGGLVGPKFGFDWMTMKSATGPEFKNDLTFKENRLFLDFALQPYLSVNLLRTIKISFSAEFDMPIFRARFTKEPDVGEYVFNWDWFKNDIPITYFAGVAIIF